MTLRTPNPGMNRQTLLDLQRVKERLAVYTEQLSSGKRITRLGDDPTGAAIVLDFNASISRNSQYSKAIDSANAFLSTTEDGLTQLNTDLTRLLELGTQGTGTSTTASGRAALASEVDALRTNILAVGNMQSQGKYVFAGTNTLTIPFSGPAAGPITYAGDGNSIDLDVSMGTTVSTNLAGDQVFFGGPAATAQGSSTDLFQQVTDLRDGLQSNNTAQIQTAYNNLKTIFQRVNSLTTEVGGRQSGITQMKDTLSSYNLTLTSIKDTYEAVDYAETATNYATDQTAQNAAYSVLAKTNSQNLFDFLT